MQINTREINNNKMFIVYKARQQNNVTLEKQKARYSGPEMCPLKFRLDLQNRRAYKKCFSCYIDDKKLVLINQMSPYCITNIFKIKKNERRLKKIPAVRLPVLYPSLLIHCNPASNPCF